MYSQKILGLIGSLALVASCSDSGGQKIDGKTPNPDGQVSSSGKACLATCNTVTDCPKASAGFTYTCVGGLCDQIWCSSSADCKLALLPSCIKSSHTQQCLPSECNTASCTSGECHVVFPGYKGCVPAGTPIDCTVDGDCVPPNFSPGHTKCQQGYCGCESDIACQAAKTGAGLTGTWRCLSFGGPGWSKL